MTKEELLNGLEGLKDLVNDGGKRQIDTFKAAVRELVKDNAANTPDAQVPYTPDAEAVHNKFQGRHKSAHDLGGDR